MKRLSTSTAVALCLSFLPCAASAATYSIDSMNITVGSATFDTFTSAFDYIGPDTNLIAGYIGSGGASVDNMTLNPSRIASISNWFGLPGSFYTASSNLGDLLSPPGTYTGGPVASGVLDNVAGSISIDLRSWFVNWADGDYISGTGRNDGITSAMANGIWNPATHAYSLSWTSLTIGPDGSLCAAPVGCVTYWTLEGTANPVPVPAAIWLFGSGLFGLFGLQRWQKSNRK